MASFDTPARWEKYLPPIANNRELERPFHLLIQAGLTKPRFETLLAALSEASRRLAQEDAAEGPLEGTSALELYVGALEGLVRFGDEPLTLNGQLVTDLRGLLAQYLQQAGYELLFDLVAYVRRWNMIAGAIELFTARLSGGSAGTAPAPKTAAR